ncbi:MAG TPA: DUF1778 domain-containing protein [Urbifossiella sp.]|nr:DUF1778 domain-containing protein [Urbifossiella sp.]
MAVTDDIHPINSEANGDPLTEAGDDDELPPLPHLRPLSDRDRDMFLAVMANPPEPNEALKKLMANRTL